MLMPLIGNGLALLVGFAAAGVGGALLMLGGTVLLGAVWHLVTGRPVLGVPGRRAGAVLVALSLVGMGVGGATAAPPTGPTTTASASAPASAATRPSRTPTAAPTADDLADPDDPALNQAQAAMLARPAVPPTGDTSTTLAAAQGQDALVALAALVVDDSPTTTGYQRDLFGYRAVDLDRNGCDTRNDILRRDLHDVVLKPGTNDCVVLSGTLADPYSGETITFTRGTSTSNDVQIDHVVALADAWASGASAWDQTTRYRLGNDPLNLLAVSGPLNTQKSDGNAAEWLPPSTAYRCAYVARQIGVKYTYRLTVTTPERAAMAAVLATCPDEPLPAGSTLPAPVVPAPAPAAPEPAAPALAAPAPAAPGPAPAPAAPAPQPAAPATVYYENCTAARAAGAAPILEGQPGYRPALDRDKDGIACE